MAPVATAEVVPTAEADLEGNGAPAQAATEGVTAREGSAEAAPTAETPAAAATAAATAAETPTAANTEAALPMEPASNVEAAQAIEGGGTPALAAAVATALPQRPHFTHKI